MSIRALLNPSKSVKTALTATLLALSISTAFAAENAVPEHQTQGFLNALAAGGGKPLEQMSPKDARAVLTGAQNSVKVDLSGTQVTQKTISADGQNIQLTIVRPANVKGQLPVFMYFHGGGWVLGDYPTHARLIRDLVWVRELWRFM
jgi:acetyl esterase/lipase